MLQILKAAMLVAAVGFLVPSAAYADEKKDAKAEEASDMPHDRSFEETREFMKKHSEESKRTGKM